MLKRVANARKHVGGQSKRIVRRRMEADSISQEAVLPVPVLANTSGTFSMEGILGVLDVDSSIHLKQVDLDYAASFNKNEISGISDTYIVILIMSEYCRRGQHFNGRDNFVDECINSCGRNSRANLQWNFTEDLRCFVCEWLSKYRGIQERS